MTEDEHPGTQEIQGEDTAGRPSVDQLLEADLVCAELVDRDFGPFIGVPCSYLAPLITVLESQWPGSYITATNEGEAVALAAGSVLAGRRPVVLLQNSGLGNTVNPLSSLCATFDIPMLLFVGWRGVPGRRDEPQHILMGKSTIDILSLMEVSSSVLPSRWDDFLADLDQALSGMLEKRRPHAFLVAPGVLAKVSARKTPSLSSISRTAAISEVMAGLDDRSVVVSTTGYISRELESGWDRPNNIYIVGSMGCASSVALGLARHVPDRTVVVLDGDGAALMRMESFASIGHARCANLQHVILDNGRYASTGSQPTISDGIDFAGVAMACGYSSAADVSRAQQIRVELVRMIDQPGPHLLRVPIFDPDGPELPRPRLTPPEVAQRLTEFLAVGD